MGFTFSDGIPVIAGFKLVSAMPLNVLDVVDTRQDLNLPTHPTKPGVFLNEYRCIGRTVFVVDEGVEYQLKKGLTDDHWEVKSAGSASIIGTWSKNTEFLEGQIIWCEGQLWRAKSTHTSSYGEFGDDSAYWESTAEVSFDDSELDELVGELTTEGYIEE